MEDLKLIRHHLGGIDLSDVIDQEEMSETERKEYAGAIFAVFPHIERDIKKFLYNQLLFQAKEAGNWEQVLFGRGVFEGMAMLLEHWRQVTDEHFDKRENQFDKHSPLSEI